MVKGRSQREGDVVRVIVRKCFDLTKMLDKLVQREQDDLHVLMLSRADEKSAPYQAQNKRTQVREQTPKDAFNGDGISSKSHIACRQKD